MKLVIALLAASVAACIVPTQPLTVEDQERALMLEMRGLVEDPRAVEVACAVDPIGFDRRLVVRSPQVGFDIGSAVTYATLLGVADDGATTFSMVLTRKGYGWLWLKLPPNVTLPGDITLPAVKASAEVLQGSLVAESYALFLTREQVEAFGSGGFEGDIAHGPRVSFPPGLFAGFLARWDAEVVAYEGGGEAGG